jgi:hypothetical protein
MSSSDKVLLFRRYGHSSCPSIILTNSIFQLQSFGWTVVFVVSTPALLAFSVQFGKPVQFVVCMKPCYVQCSKICPFKYSGCCKSLCCWRQHMSIWLPHHSTYMYLRDVEVSVLNYSMFCLFLRYVNWCFCSGEDSHLLYYEQGPLFVGLVIEAVGMDLTVPSVSVLASFLKH